MITVNLLPPHLRPVKRTPLPHLISLLVLVLVLGGLALVFLGIQATKMGLNSEIASTRDQYNRFAAIVKESNELTEDKERLQGKIETIQEILSDRIVWSEQLYHLTRLTPDNMWYRRIRTTFQSFPEEQAVIDPKTGKQEINKRTKQPVFKRVVVKRPMLEVSGYIINDKEGSNQLYPLSRSTTTDPEFSKTFKLFKPFTEPAEFEGYSVQSFTLEYSIISEGDAQ